MTDPEVKKEEDPKLTWRDYVGMSIVIVVFFFLLFIFPHWRIDELQTEIKSLNEKIELCIPRVTQENNAYTIIRKVIVRANDGENYIIFQRTEPKK